MSLLGMSLKVDYNELRLGYLEDKRPHVIPPDSQNAISIISLMQIFLP